jgi:hypothetical protein
VFRKIFKTSIDAAYLRMHACQHFLRTNLVVGQERDFESGYSHKYLGIELRTSPVGSSKRIHRSKRAHHGARLPAGPKSSCFLRQRSEPATRTVASHAKLRYSASWWCATRSPIPLFVPNRKKKRGRHKQQACCGRRPVATVVCDDENHGARR